MLFEDEDKSDISDLSYVPSDDDGELDMILSDAESNCDSISDSEDNEDLTDVAFTATLTSRDGKESWSTSPINSSQGRTTARNIFRESSRPTR